MPRRKNPTSSAPPVTDTVPPARVAPVESVAVDCCGTGCPLKNMSMVEKLVDPLSSFPDDAVMEQPT